MVSSDVPVVVARSPSETMPTRRFFAIEHREPAHLQGAHVAGKVFGGLVLEDVFHLGRHHLADLALGGVLSGGYRPYADVAVGQHADEPVLVRDRNGADVELGHQACRLLQGLRWRGQLDVAGHDFGDLHGFGSFADETAAPLARGHAGNAPPREKVPAADEAPAYVKRRGIN